MAKDYLPELADAYPDIQLRVRVIADKRRDAEIAAESHKMMLAAEQKRKEWEEAEAAWRRKFGERPHNLHFKLDGFEHLAERATGGPTLIGFTRDDLLREYDIGQKTTATEATKSSAQAAAKSDRRRRSKEPGAGQS